MRIVARDVPYYSDDSRWWSPDTYFKGGQLRAARSRRRVRMILSSMRPSAGGTFPTRFPSRRGSTPVTLHFIEHHAGQGECRGFAEERCGRSEDRVFNVFCNGKTILANAEHLDEVGENHPLVRKIKGLEPNAQGKLLLEFVPVTRYATVSAIEVMPE